ncbi:MAG: tRNA (N6-isopentenyl adenosine(37)-C2)-methylthiotransferase MiaB [Deltaproteobacteria bacterium]|nr:tRNA (N6-isopentenyl adenosine(37)-C2)-methylthiotransferase MiaB [Deltaproteobacteria bacterium]
MNVHDSEQICALLEGEEYEMTKDAQTADLIIINTCSIREKAAQKAYSQLGRYRALKQKNDSLIIGVGGCLAQELGHTFYKKFPHVDFIFGTHNINKLPEILKKIELYGERVTETDFRESVKSIGIFALPDNGSLSAFVTIMQGCNNFCSYCVVPYLRGREESRPLQDIIDEIHFLVDHGVKEVTLLGQNVNSYGHTISEDTNFPSLLRKIGKINGIERIRFTTSHPKDLSEDLIRCYGEIAQLCEHIHLPVQSGADRILKKMNRKYTAKDYLNKVDRLRAQCPAISITSDVIVGFPGETQEDFKSTLALMDYVMFDNLFSFKYSERKGTKALKCDSKVPEPVKLERLKLLQAKQEEHTFRRNKVLKGRIEEILVEGISKNCQNDLTGRTRSNKIANFKGTTELIGKMVPVVIKEPYLHSLRAELITEGEVQAC